MAVRMAALHITACGSDAREVLFCSRFGLRVSFASAVSAAAGRSDGFRGLSTVGRACKRQLALPLVTLLGAILAKFLLIFSLFLAPISSNLNQVLLVGIVLVFSYNCILLHKKSI